MKLALLAVTLYVAPSVFATPVSIEFQCQDPLGPPTGFAGGDGSAQAVATANAGFQSSFESPKTCISRVTAELLTPGPTRDGFLGISLSGSADGNYGPFFDSFKINGDWLGSCGPIGCIFPGQIPFVLGVPFEMTVEAEANITAPDKEGESLIQATIHVFELVPSLPGSTFLVPRDVPIFVAPEPASWLLTVAGLLGLVGWGSASVAGRTNLTYRGR